MRALVVVLLAGVGCGGLMAPERQIVQKFDRFDGSQSTSLTNVPLVEDAPYAVTKRLNFDHIRLKVEPAGRFFGTLTAYNNTKEWLYIKCHSVAFLADGRPVAVGATEHDGKVETYSSGQFSMREVVRFEVPREAMQAFAKAERLEGKICNDEFGVDAAGQAAIRRFLDTVDGRAVPEPSGEPAEQL